MESISEAEGQWLSFTVGDEIYAIEIIYVKEILEYREVSLIPGAPSHILGMINLRGGIYSVTDVRSFLGLPKSEIYSQSRIILLELNGFSMGMLVDNVAEIITVRQSEIETSGDPEMGNPYMQGIYHQNDKLFILLRAQELMED